MVRATITHCGDIHELPQRLQRMYGDSNVRFREKSDARCGLHQIEVEIDEADRDWRSVHRRGDLFDEIEEFEDVSQVHYVEC